MGKVYRIGEDSQPRRAAGTGGNPVVWACVGASAVLVGVAVVMGVGRAFAPGAARSRSLAGKPAGVTGTPIAASGATAPRSAVPPGNPPAGNPAGGPTPFQAGGAPATPGFPVAGTASRFPAATPSYPGAIPPTTATGAPAGGVPGGAPGYPNGATPGFPGSRPPVYQPAATPAPTVATRPDPLDVIARVKASTLLILVESPEGISSGTGFVIGPSEIATCAHVVQGAQRIVAIASDGRQFNAVLGPMNEGQDVAVIRTPPGLPPALPLGDSSRVRDGEEVAVTGYPVVDTFLTLGYAPTPSTSRGTISAHRSGGNAYQGELDELQTDATINPGNSGGPLYLLRDGSVVGLAARTLRGRQGLNLASSVNTLRRLIGR